MIINLLKRALIPLLALHFSGCSSSGKLFVPENNISGVTVNEYLNQFPAETNIKQFLLGKSLVEWERDSLKVVLLSLDSADPSRAVLAQYAIQSIS